MRKIVTLALVGIVSAIALPVTVFAHVIVTPAQATIGSSTLFSISVPNERSTAVSSLKINIPNGVTSVQPNAIAGWSIATDTSDGGNISSITWTGSIPVGQRADLLFKAQTPATAQKLDWKAYQKYADGIVVSWDQAPTASKTDDDAAVTGPYSVTDVVDDLSQPATITSSATNSGMATIALALSVAALLLASLALLHKRRP